MTAIATRRTAWALLAAALVLGVCAKCPGLGPRQWERDSNQPTRPGIADVQPTLTPPPGAGAAMVRRQLADAREGLR